MYRKRLQRCVCWVSICFDFTRFLPSVLTVKPFYCYHVSQNAVRRFLCITSGFIRRGKDASLPKNSGGVSLEEQRKLLQSCYPHRCPSLPRINPGVMYREHLQRCACWVSICFDFTRFLPSVLTIKPFYGYHVSQNAVRRFLCITSGFIRRGKDASLPKNSGGVSLEEQRKLLQSFILIVAPLSPR